MIETPTPPSPPSVIVTTMEDNHNNNSNHINNGSDNGSSNSKGSSFINKSKSSKKTPSSGCLPFDMDKTLVLRVCFIASLVAAAAVCGFIAHWVITSLEADLASQTYESVAAMALMGAQAITIRKLQGGTLLASVLGHAFPDASEWPFVALDGYDDIAQEIAALSSSTTVAFNMIVTPKQIPLFEAFAQQVYQDHGYPETAGVNGFGFGIFSKTDVTEDNLDGRYHDTTGETTFGSKYNIVAPIFQHNNKDANSLLYNVHSSEPQGRAIDGMLDCSKAATSSANATEKPQCGAITGFFELIVRPGPAALLYQPIYPANDPTNMVAMSATTIHWEEVLTNIVPDYIDGLVCVVSTGAEFNTYTIRKGKPVFEGEGDLHDRQYTDKGHTVILNDIATNVLVSKKYTLTVYPSKEMQEKFETKAPLTVAVGFVCIILFCTAIFFLYDFFMRDESRRRRTVLDIKRKFVRFISHEIRTPLNTVCMGLELLQVELGVDPDADPAADPAKPVKERTVSKYSLELTHDIMENVNNAITILNDLLNYDKIETGTFRLEIEPVHIFRLLSSVVNSFHIDAKKKSQVIRYTIDGESVDEEKGLAHLDNFIVIGDGTRIRQIIRNLMSNAIKFTSESKEIEVEITRNPNGLAKAPPIASGAPTSEVEEKMYSTYARSGSLLIAVKDQGIGLSKEQVSQLFKEGVQFDVNRLQAGGGSGLGLHISKGLVEQHGGKICAQSKGLGLGSSFSIELPLYEPLHNIDAVVEKITSQSGHIATDNGYGSDTCTAEPASSGSEPSHGDKRPRKVLVVDDVLSNRKLLLRLLEHAGHTCAGAVNGQEAIDMFLADKESAKDNEGQTVFDTILMDYEMPILNGPDAAKRLKDLNCGALIIGITGNVLPEDVAYFKSMGADNVVSKPVKMAVLDELWSQYPLNR